jgi:hypothetical protein
VDPVKVGIQGYEIKQGLHEGTMTLQLVFANPTGSCEAYADFLRRLDEFLDVNGYSFKFQTLFHNACSNVGEDSQRYTGNF